MLYSVSPSEVDAYRACKRKHYYSFGFIHKGKTGIASQTHSASLQRGTDGHSILGDYYQMRIEGVDHHEATVKSIGAASKVVVERIASGDTLGRSTMSEAMNIVGNYFQHYGDEAGWWQPLAAEKEFRLQISDKAVMAFKPDAIFRNKKSGKITIVDHKFLYNPYRTEVLGIMPQLPKYAAALNRLGYKVEVAMYNILSTRKNVKKNAFMRPDKALKPNVLNGFWNEQVEATIEIAALKENPEQWSKAPRTASYFNCKNCPFLQLCIAELEGQQGINLMVETFYKPNDYRYDNVESSDD